MWGPITPFLKKINWDYLIKMFRFDGNASLKELIKEYSYLIRPIRTNNPILRNQR